MKIFTIIVTYNGSKWIEKCLNSLINSSIPTEIIVIDNLSIDNTVFIIRERFSTVTLIESKENLGFAKANNIGIKYALDNDADYVFLLNQDAWIEEDTISKLLSTLEKKTNAGIVSPIQLNGKKTDFDFGFANYILKENTPCFISDLYFNRLQENYETQFVNAAAWMISRKCIEKVGGFDTSIFYHYGEDDNFCQRTIYHNFKIYINTTTTICHDREERKGARPKEHEEKIMEVYRRVCSANILIDDQQIEQEFFILRKKNKRRLLKSYLKFDFKKAKKIKKNIVDDSLLFKTIKISRQKNKNGNMVWLS